MTESKINSDMQILNNFTPASDTTVLYAKFTENNGLIVFNFELYNDKYAARSEFVLGTIPSAYAPQYSKYFAGVTVDASFSVNNNLIVFVLPNGQITAKTGGTGGRYLICNGEYAIHNS